MPDAAPESSLNKAVENKQASLKELMARREKARAREVTELNKKRETAGFTEESHISFFQRFTTKQYIILGGALVASIIVFQIATFIYRTQLPNWAMEEYQTALDQKDYPTAAERLETYLTMQPEDWETTAAGGEFYLEIGNNVRARTLLSRLLSNSPLSSDTYILFLSAVSNMPNVQATYSKISELLISHDTFAPALLVRGVLDAKERPEDSAEAFEEALAQIARLNTSQETYHRYQTLLGLFLMSICRESPGRLDNQVVVPFDRFPAQLNREHDLLVYGIDATISTNFCGLIPNNKDWVDNFNPNLEALGYFLQAYSLIANKQYVQANVAIGQSTRAEYLPYASFLDGCLLILDKKLAEANTAYLRSGGSDDVATQSNIAIVQLLTATEASRESATTSLDGLIALAPQNLGGLNNRAVLALLQGRLPPAQNDLTTALELDPDYLQANYNLAIINYLESEYDESSRLLTNLRDSNEFLPGLYYYKGKSNFQIGDTERALNDLRQALTTPAYNVLADIALGDYYNTQDLTKDIALEHYRTAFETNPKNYEAALKYAGTRIAESEGDDPLMFIDDINDSFTDLIGSAKAEFNEHYHSERARIMYEAEMTGAEQALREVAATLTNKQLRINSSIQFVNLLLQKKGDELTDETNREALDVTRTILPLAPKNISLLLLRARALAKANDLDQAMRIVDNALDLDSHSSEALLTRGDILALDQRWDAAVESYQDAFDSNPINSEPLVRAIALLAEQDKDSPQLAAFRQILEEVEKKKNQVASALADDPNDAEIRLQLGDRAQSVEDVDEIKKKIGQLEKLIDQQKIEDFAGYINLGALYTKIGDINNALLHMDKATQSENIPDDEAYKPWLNISQLYVLQGNYSQAEVALTKVIELNPPKISKYYFLRGGVREKIDPILSIEDYDQVIILQPNSYQALFRRGVNKLNLEDIEGAIADFSQCIKIEPENIEAYRVRRSAYGLVGDRQSAARDAEIINILSAKQSQ